MVVRQPNANQKNINEVEKVSSASYQKAMVKQEYNEALEQTLKRISLPEGYVLKHVKSQKQNDDDVWVFRYEKESGENNGLAGEHYSFVVQKSNYTLLGVTWMDASLSFGELPSQQETKVLAGAFLDKVEPGLFKRLDNLWIDRHDEMILVKNSQGQNEQVTVTGMKYKCYLKDEDNYAWVIVGSGGQIITFEQGIIWQGGRVTEKWLHDSWLQQVNEK